MAPVSKAWDKFSEEIQYKIILDLENGISRPEICVKYGIGLTGIQKLRKHSDKIKEKRRQNDKISPALVEVETQTFDPDTKPGVKNNPSSALISDRERIIMKIKIPPTPNKVDFNSSSEFGKQEMVGKPQIPISVVPKIVIKEESEYVPADTPVRPSGKTADWDHILEEGQNLKYIAPVKFFKHAPLVDIWKDLARVGRVIEAPNPFIRCGRPVNWIATVVHFAGYKALTEFECFGMIPKYMSWMSFCSDIPKPIGFSEKNKILLHPPHQVRAEHPDYLGMVLESLCTGLKETIPDNHNAIIVDALKKCQKYPLNTILEVLDIKQISRMRLARVTCLVGDRIHVTHITQNGPNDIGFWFSVNSDQIHPLGWSATVEHEIFGVSESVQFAPLGLEHFPKYPDNIKLERGQYLEVRHPVQPYRICAAVIHHVLKCGYFVVEINVLVEEVRKPTQFTYHVTSPYIFYCGFCEKHGIKITPPHGESPDHFTWDDYIRRYNVVKAPLDLLPRRPTHHFKPGMKAEIVDVIQPTYLGPCTILRSAEHLLHIHFDGWRRESSVDCAEYWMDAESPDIYPVGYAEMVGHEFNGCAEHIDPTEFTEVNRKEKTEMKMKTDIGEGEVNGKEGH